MTPPPTRAALKTWCAAQALLGLVLWLLNVVVARPCLETDAWPRSLLCLAALVIVPLGLRLVLDDRPGVCLQAAVFAQPLAAWWLLFELNSPLGGSAFWSWPWTALTALLAAEAIVRLFTPRPRSAHDWAHTAALGYIAIGGAWTLISRLNLRPLDFDPLIVLLTAVHFHYAGFALPVAAGCAARRLPGAPASATVAGVIVGVPLVAAGITAAQLHRGPALECVAALVTAAAGCGVAVLHLQASMQPGVPGVVRWMLNVAAAALAMSMVLAALYGGRALWPAAALSIPRMQALHGTANALGFALLALVAWNALPSIRPPPTSH